MVNTPIGGIGLKEFFLFVFIIFIFSIFFVSGSESEWDLMGMAFGKHNFFVTYWDKLNEWFLGSWDESSTQKGASTCAGLFGDEDNLNFKAEEEIEENTGWVEQAVNSVKGVINLLSNVILGFLNFVWVMISGCGFTIGRFLIGVFLLVETIIYVATSYNLLNKLMDNLKL